MHKKIAKAVAATFMATTLLSTTVATVVPMSVSATKEVLGETGFDYKALPWHTCESNPAKQDFNLEEVDGNGAFHIKVTEPVGAEKSKWDLQFRHRNLNFTAGHVYKVSFRVKSNREGMELCSKIGDMSGDLEYFELDGNAGNMHNGPHMDGQWGSPAKLSTSWKTFEGEFKPSKDIEGAEWAFHYANDSNGWGGNAQKGDELWFDDMHIEDTTAELPDEIKSYGQTSRDWSPELGSWHTGKETVNFISVNQVGYYPNLSKVATLGDNAGDILYGATKIELGDNPYDYEIVDAATGEVADTGKTTPIAGIDADSGDKCHKIDFTDFTKEGRYYLRIKGENWRSYEFDINDHIYSTSEHNMLVNALNYFYQNRSGLDIEEKYITSGDKTTLAHEGGHKTDSATIQNAWVKTYKTEGKKGEGISSCDALTTYKSSVLEDGSGGWYDAGDHGKYVVNGGISVWTLQNMYERTLKQGNKDKFGDGSKNIVVPESSNGVPDILDECAYELDWMEKMIVKSDEPTWGKYAGLVYHKLHDQKWTGLATRPLGYEKEWLTCRIVKPPTYTATLNFVACAAQAARLWKDVKPAKADHYLELAKTSFEAFKTHYKAKTGDNDTNPLWPPLDQAIGGGAYGDSEALDDAYWAACELYATTGEKEYYDYINQPQFSKYAFTVVDELNGGENKGSFSSFNWGCTSSCGSLSLYLNRDNAALKDLTQANKDSIVKGIVAASDKYIAKENAQAYGIPYEGSEYTDPVNLPADVVIKGYEWGSNSFVVNNAMVMAYAYDETQDVQYMNGVITAMDYLFGRNPMAYSYVSGYGSYKLVNPHHRYWSHELDKTLPLAPDGVMSGGANAGLQDPYVRALGFVPGDNDNNYSQRCYVDSIEAWSTNEVTINWNSPFAWVVSFLDDEAADATSKGLSVSPSSVTVKVGETAKINAKVDGQPASDATYASSDEGVVTVSPDGTVTGVKEGTATITVTAGGETKEVTVTVTNGTTPTDKPTDKPTDQPTTGPTGPTETLPPYTGDKTKLKYGDVNLDGDVTPADIVQLVKYVIAKDTYPLGKGTPESEAQAKEQGNVEYDNTLDTKDSGKIKEFILKHCTEDDLGPKNK